MTSKVQRLMVLGRSSREGAMRIHGQGIAEARPWAIVAFSLSMLVVLSVGVWGSDWGLAVRLAGSAVGTGQPRLIPLPVGLIIQDKAPKGWSHMVLKSVPRLESGDRDSLPASAAKTATMFRMVILADVKPTDVDEQDWVLDRVGLGICVPRDEDQDIVVSSDRVDALGVRLSTVERLVLDSAEAELAEGRIIARTPTFALFRSPSNLVVGDKHRRVAMYYAFCVEPKKGDLKVAVWAMRPETEPQQPPVALVHLGKPPVYDCGLDVQAKRVLGMVPYSWSFAMRALPPGRSLRIPPALGDQIASTARHPRKETTEQIEQGLLDLLTVPVEPVTRATFRQTTPPPGYQGGR